MSGLTDADLLHLWEAQRSQPMPQRAAALLAAADPALDPRALASLALGERERRLLALRSDCFGARLQCVADCPACGERCDFELDARLLADCLVPHTDSDALCSFELDGCRIALRVPTIGDSLAVAEVADAGAAYRLLLQRCVQATASDGAVLAPDELPEPVRQAIDERLESIDPAADLQLALTCPACQAASSTPLDVAAYCWSEIEAYAPRLLADVHVLAARYGWHEADILGMSRLRRAHYLALADA